MTPNVENLFNELSIYEKDGTDSMAWAEYDCQLIDEKIAGNFTENDWSDVDKFWKSKSNNIKSLLTHHIHLSDLNSAKIQLKILTEMVMTENDEVAFEALRQISFCFVTSGFDSAKNQYYSKESLKGIFLSEEDSLLLIHQYFDSSFINKVKSISAGCSESWENEFLEFLKIIKKY